MDVSAAELLKEAVSRRGSASETPVTFERDIKIAPKEQREMRIVQYQFTVKLMAHL
jgi:hypothetical protein